VTILAQARRSVDKKIAEASLTSELKLPLNGKDEMEGIDFNWIRFFSNIR
jgi:hypothetical protein